MRPAGQPMRRYGERVVHERCIINDAHNQWRRRMMMCIRAQCDYLRHCLKTFLRVIVAPDITGADHLLF